MDATTETRRARELRAWTTGTRCPRCGAVLEERIWQSGMVQRSCPHGHVVRCIAPATRREGDG